MPTPKKGLHICKDRRNSTNLLLEEEGRSKRKTPLSEIFPSIDWIIRNQSPIDSLYQDSATFFLHKQPQLVCFLLRSAIDGKSFLKIPPQTQSPVWEPFLTDTFQRCVAIFQKDICDSSISLSYLWSGRFRGMNEFTGAEISCVHSSSILDAKYLPSSREKPEVVN